MHWPELMERFKSAPLLVGHLATVPLRGFVDAAQADAAEAFFAANPTPQASLGIAQALEGIRARAACATTNLPGIHAFLMKWQADLAK